ncbi:MULTISPECIES: type II toxin-antitoxin system VapC family toxin [Pseudanabaena]|uniref:type II toxin-antitoxin system VapC family toxin n=1 Tax=Pseudanabaena TaxID=1152 RepID=UPI002479F7F5|nr:MULTISPECIES: PIN domain-containing protein [Pseudanabaena]WGS71121.1 PIN domain-containing protein [Pseudanabaena galeata CCNP1313]
MILAIMKYILDTHALIWFLEGNPRLGLTAKEILSDSSSELILPAIALAESVWIVSRGKTSIPSVDALLKVVKQDKRVAIYSLDSEVIEKSVSLISINEMHDRQIVSTALVVEEQGNQVALLSCDQNICAANLARIIW